MNKLKLLLFVSFSFFLMSCGKSDFSGQTYQLRIPTSAYTVEDINWPVELPLAKTDGCTYWEFSDGSFLYTSTYSAEDTIEHVTEIKENEKYQINTAAKTRTIIYDNAHSYGKEVKNILCTATTSVYVPNLPKKAELKKLPEYNVVDISIDDNGMAMPTDYVSDSIRVDNIYSSSMYLQSPTSYITAFILDRTKEEAFDELCSLTCCGQAVTDWYYNSDNNIFYIHSGDRYMVAKAIRDNEWYVYIGTADFLNAMISGVMQVSYAD